MKEGVQSCKFDVSNLPNNSFDKEGSLELLRSLSFNFCRFCIYSENSSKGVPLSNKTGTYLGHC